MFLDTEGHFEFNSFASCRKWGSTLNILSNYVLVFCIIKERGVCVRERERLSHTAAGSHLPVLSLGGCAVHSQLLTPGYFSIWIQKHSTPVKRTLHVRYNGLHSVIHIYINILLYIYVPDWWSKVWNNYVFEKKVLLLKIWLCFEGINYI